MRKAIICAFLLVSAAQAEGEELGAGTGTAGGALPGSVYSQAEIDAKLEQLNSEILNLREMSRVQLDAVSADAGDAKSYINNILLIFLGAVAIISYLLVNGFRHHQNNQVLRMRRLIKDGETVLNDIDKLMSRPDVEHYRANQKLSKVKSQLKESADRSLSQTHVRDVYAVASDPNLPALLFVQAKAIKAEQAGNWAEAVTHWEEVVAMDGNDPDNYLHLAHTYKNLSSTHTGAEHERYLQLSLKCYQEYANRTKGLHEAFKPPPLPFGEAAAPPPAIEVHRPVHIAAQPAQPSAAPRMAPVAPPPLPRPPAPPQRPKPSRITAHRPEPAATPPPAPPAPPAAAPAVPEPGPATPPLVEAPVPPVTSGAFAAAPAAPEPETPLAPTPPPAPVFAAPGQPPVAAPPAPAERGTNLISGARSAAGRLGGGTGRLLGAGWSRVKTAASSIGNLRRDKETIRVFSAGDDLDVTAGIVDGGMSAEEIGRVERQVERENAARPQAAPPAPRPTVPPQPGRPAPAGARPVPEAPRKDPSTPTSALLKTKPSAHTPIAPNASPRIAAQTKANMDNLRMVRDQKAATAGNGQAKAAANGAGARPEAPPRPQEGAAAGNGQAAKANGSGREDAAAAADAPPGRDAELETARGLFEKSLELNGEDTGASRESLSEALGIYERLADGADDPGFFRDWGLALTAKAVDSSGKRRSELFEKAADKLKEGNLRSPHQNDFLLASLYALYGKERQCRKWLDESRDSGQLDTEMLRTVPEFEQMRAKPWFGKYLDENA